MYLKFKLIIIFLSVQTLLFSQDLFDVEKIRDFKLSFYNANWRQQLDLYKKKGTDQRVLAKLEVDGLEYDSVGVKFKGNSSYNAKFIKNPLNIKLDYKIKNQNLYGYKTLKLSNIFMDPSAIREVLAFGIIGKYIPSPKACFVQLFINDSITGLYTNVEVVNKKLIKSFYTYKNGAFFKCENTKRSSKPENCNIAVSDGLTIGYTLDSNCYIYNYELQSKSGWNSLLNLMMTLWYNSDKSTVYYQQIDKVLDIDKVMWMLAFNNLFVNLDSYNWSGRNYYMVEDSNKIFHPVMWDMNMCFGGFCHFYDADKLAEFPVYSCENNIYRPLISKLFLVPTYKQLYINHYKTLLKNEILNGEFELQALKLHKQISPYITKDPYFYYQGKSFDNSLYQTYNNQIPGIIELMNNRIRYLKLQKDFKNLFTEN